jgi:hypothetical protein
MRFQQEHTERGASLAEPGRDTSTAGFVGESFEAQEAKRGAEIDAKIAMGWGDTPPERIPADWRSRRGVERCFTVETKAKMSANKRLRDAAKIIVARGTVVRLN